MENLEDKKSSGSVIEGEKAARNVVRETWKFFLFQQLV